MLSETPSSPLLNKPDEYLFNSHWAYASQVDRQAGRDAMPVFTGADNMFIMRQYEPVPGFDDRFYPTENLIVLDSIMTWSTSYSSARTQTRIMGRRNPIGMTVGPRTVAGTIVAHYTVTPGILAAHPVFAEKGFNYIKDGVVTEEFYDMLKELLLDAGSLLPDSTSPFDIYIRSNNESGYEVGSLIYGVSIVSGGEVRNVNDMTVEITYQYIANGAIGTLPARVIDRLAISSGDKWAKFIKKISTQQEKYGFISIGKRRF